MSLHDAWTWDFWLADTGHEYHAFFLRASRALTEGETWVRLVWLSAQSTTTAVSDSTTELLLHYDKQLIEKTPRSSGERCNHRAEKPGFSFSSVQQLPPWPPEATAASAVISPAATSGHFQSRVPRSLPSRQRCRPGDLALFGKSVKSRQPNDGEFSCR